jgi:hypothetical protein
MNSFVHHTFVGAARGGCSDWAPGNTQMVVQLRLDFYLYGVCYLNMEDSPFAI